MDDERTVHEHEDGTITIRHAGRELAHRAYPRDEGRITPGAIVENTRLEDVLAWIAEQQRQRDSQRLVNPKITLRARRRIREAAALTAYPARPDRTFLRGKEPDIPTSR